MIAIVHNKVMTETMYTITRPSSDFTAESSEGIRGVRAKFLSLPILLVWIGRHVVFDHYKNSKWFGGSEANGDFEFWFKLEKDRNQCEKFFEEILKYGVPRHKHYE